MAALKLSQKVESQIRFRYILDQLKITYTISILQERNVLPVYKDKHKAMHILSQHHIPHHTVKKDTVTPPIRIVNDCSCKQTLDRHRKDLSKSSTGH